MPASPLPRAALATVALLVASIAVVLGTLPAAAQRPPIRVLPTPPPSGVTSTQAHVPMGTERFAPTTSTESDARPATPGPVAQSIIGADQESVIEADDRQAVTESATSGFPLSAIGQIEFVQNGTLYICTGTLIDANSVLTAGHCSFEGGADDPIESARFFAGRNRQSGEVVNPYGSCSMVAVWAPAQWRLEGTPAHDYSVQQLDCRVGDQAGWFGLFTLPGVNAFAGRRLRVEGYPGDKLYGSRWKMAGAVQRNSVNMLHYPMDTYGGQSGSPLFKWNRPSCGGPCSAGVHAYGASGTPATNSGPMMTAGRISTIVAVAAENGG